MNITANEIDSIEEAGMLDGSPVKMIRTKGGFWICVGKLASRGREEALAAGSHPAIVKYNLEKQYPHFQASMMKSEYFIENTVVDRHSHFLSEDLRKSGHDIYSVQNGSDVEFHVTKNNIKVSSVKGALISGAMQLQELNIDKAFSRALAGATTEKAMALGADKIQVIRK